MQLGSLGLPIALMVVIGLGVLMATQRQIIGPLSRQGQACQSRSSAATAASVMRRFTT